MFEPGSRLKTIEEDAFRGCANLVRINLPERLKSIGPGAFWDCSSLRDIQLPDRLEKIGPRCFWGSGLEEIVLPSSVKEVGAVAFKECRQLRSVQLNEGLKKLGAKERVNGIDCEGIVFLGSAIEEIYLPSTLKRLEFHLFEDCRNLRSI